MGILFTIILVAIIFLIHPSNGHPEVSSTTRDASSPHYEKSDVESIWQSPASPQGLLFLAHGCHHSATDWWRKSEACPACIGLPEELRIVKAALDARLIVLAISSQNRQSKCWSWRDVDPVQKTISNLTKRLHLDGLPLYALGVSSGGGFVSMLPEHQEAHIPVKALAIQVMSFSEASISAAFPPTAFLNMERDSHTAGRVAEDIGRLQKLKIPVKHWPQLPKPLTATYFSDRIDSMTPEISSRLYNALRQADYLNEKGELKTDPRRSSWRKVLRESVPETQNMTLKADSSSISEVLNVAWASHEITSENAKDTMDFFLSMRDYRPQVTAS